MAAFYEIAEPSAEILQPGIDHAVFFFLDWFSATVRDQCEASPADSQGLFNGYLPNPFPCALICRMKSTSLIVSVLLMQTLVAQAGSLYDIPLKDSDGKDTSLAAYKGKVLLIVNVASKCGLTPQYKALEAVHEKYKDKGFSVLGFPCNQFLGQEPGTNEEIKQFCSSKYNVTFPLFDKIDVNGAKRHPLYKELVGPGSPDIEWNFGKFLIGRDGKIIKRFKPTTKPDSSEVTAAIESALAAK